MNIKIIILLYLLVGIFRLLSEFFKPVPRQPIYLIERNYIGMLISILFWPLVIIIRIRSELLIKKPKIEIHNENMKKIKSTANDLDDTNYKMRCPNCGYYGFGIIDTERVQRNKDLHQQMINKGFLGSLEFSPENTPLICKKCGHNFTKNDVDIWEKMSNTFGNKMAIIEYHRKQKEIENEINEDDE